MVVERTRATEWALKVAQRLKTTRRQGRHRQPFIADALGTSISEISRLERGMRGLRVEQLGPWAKQLGMQVEIVMWMDESADGEGGIDDQSRAVLEEVAAALAFLPPPARKSLVHQMRLWRTQPGSSSDTDAG